MIPCGFDLANLFHPFFPAILPIEFLIALGVSPTGGLIGLEIVGRAYD